MNAAMQDAVRDALLDHKRTGDPIVVWQDGKVVWIPAHQIVVNEPDSSDQVSGVASAES